MHVSPAALGLLIEEDEVYQTIGVTGALPGYSAIKQALVSTDASLTATS